MKSIASRSTAKLWFLLWFIIPFVPIAVLWKLLSPVDFWQSLTMFIMCCFLYIVVLVIELGVACILSNKL